MKTRLLLTATLGILCVCPVSWAQEVARIRIVDAPDQTPGLGGGLRIGSDNYIGETSREDLVPLYLYEGKYVFAHGTSLGVHVIDTDFFTLDVLARARFDRLNPKTNETLKNLRRRHQSADGGISMGLRGRLGQLQLTGVHDILGVSNGSEVDLSYRYPVTVGNWGFTPFVSFVWQDDKLTNYYYGVSDEEATSEIPAYKPEEAVNFAWGIDATYQVTDKMFAFANLGFDTVDTTIAASPIARSQHNTYGFVGAGYLFGDQKRKVISDEARARYAAKPKWSWRLHYGYQIFHNIFPLPMAGVVNRSDRTPNLTPTQAGLTLSRLFQSGERVDFYGRLAVFRHLEEPFQKDFNSYNAYMSAMFKFYSPWTDQIAFRWGLSFGVSYAERIPAEEFQKYESRGKNSSHLLNYLEWSVDFPLYKLIKSEAVRNCYLGGVVTHRSGIFGTSDILGNVAGGSDWFGISLECMQ